MSKKTYYSIQNGTMKIDTLIILRSVMPPTWQTKSLKSVPRRRSNIRMLPSEQPDVWIISNN